MTKLSTRLWQSESAEIANRVGDKPDPQPIDGERAVAR
jgi:hypothetical protein